MLYAMNPWMLPETLQSWCATVRDQAALQVIAGATLQCQVQNNVNHAVEAGAALLEDELTLPYQDPAAATAHRAQPHRNRANRTCADASAKRTQRH